MAKNKKLKNTSDFHFSAPSEFEELEELVGHFIEYWGFKKIHGRIWVHLYTSKDPLDTLDLMQRLKVSKALMSLAMRDLLKYEVIEVSHTGKHGVVYYRANPDILKVITMVLRKREAVMLSATKTCLERLLKNKTALAQHPNLDNRQIENILTMTQSAESLLQFFLNESPAGDLHGHNISPDLFAHFLK